MKDKISSFSSLLENRGFKGKVRVDEPLSKFTSWKIGGPGDLIVFPEDRKDIALAVKLAKELNVPVTTIGNGSNILVRDGGIRGIIVITTKITHLIIDHPVITAGCGVKLNKLARSSAESSLNGLQFAAGIPGSVGGAVAMNAGAYGKSIGSFIKNITTLDENSNERFYGSDDLDFKYRDGFHMESEIIVEVSFELSYGDKDEILSEILEDENRRRVKQPLEYPSAGSVFKNPSNFPAGYLIEQAGLKGLTVGSAQVSWKHANFIVNLGGATAKEVLELSRQVVNGVFEKFGIILEREVRIMGED